MNNIKHKQKQGKITQKYIKKRNKKSEENSEDMVNEIEVEWNKLSLPADKLGTSFELK